MSNEFEVATIQDISGNWKGSIKIGPFGSQLKKEDMVIHGRKVYGQENIIANDWSLGDRRISDSKFYALQSCELEAGDVVVSMMGTIGKCAIFPATIEPGIMDSHLLRIQPNEKKIKREFLAKVLQAENIVSGQIVSKSHGSIMAGLSSAIVQSLEIPLPPLEEQSILVAILDALDAAIEKSEALIAKLKQVRAGMLHDLLTCGVDENGEISDRNNLKLKHSHAGEIPSYWQSGSLDDLVLPHRPIVYGILMPGRGFQNGVPVIKVKDIRDGRINTDDLLLTDPKIDEAYSRSRLQAGDLLFTIRGSVGRMAFVQDELAGANITQDTARISLSEKANPVFISRWLESQTASRFIQIHTLGVAVQGINLRDVRRIPVPIPSRDEQDRIASVIQSVST
jgi:type I restriction enzyme S subunit